MGHGDAASSADKSRLASAEAGSWGEASGGLTSARAASGEGATPVSDPPSLLTVMVDVLHAISTKRMRAPALHFDVVHPLMVSDCELTAVWFQGVIREWVRCGETPERLCLTFMMGLDGTPMPSLAGLLHGSDALDLVHYVLSLRAEKWGSCLAKRGRHPWPVLPRLPCAATDRRSPGTPAVPARRM